MKETMIVLRPRNFFVQTNLIYAATLMGFSLLVGFLGFATPVSAHFSLLSGNSCPTTLQFGIGEQCEITTAGEIDEYTFLAHSNDVLRIRATRTSGSVLRPRVSLRAPSGTQVCTVANGDPTVDTGCTIETTGTYTLKVDDTFSNGTGDYIVWVQRLNAPGASTPIANFGETYTGTVSLQDGVRSFTFNVFGNDLVYIAATGTSGPLSPRISVYNNTGNQVCQNSHGSPTTTIESCRLETAGQHLLMVEDSFNTLTGDFNLTVQRLNNPGSSISIDTYGTTHNGFIAPSDVMRSYTFFAYGNDTVHIGATRTTGTLRPQIQVFNKYGTQVCHAFDGDPAATIDTCLLEVAGTHLALVSDSFGTNSGDFNLFVQRLNNPGNTIPVDEFGSSYTGTVSLADAVHSYSFYVFGNDVVQITAVGTSGALRPQIRVYNRNSHLVCQAQNGDPVASIAACTLELAGTHLMLVNDTFGTLTGDYTTHIQRLNNAGNAQNFDPLGQTLTSSIDAAAEVKAFTFSVFGNDVVEIRALRTSSGSLRPRIRVVNRWGAQVCFASNGNPVASISNCTLEQSGNYSMFIDDTFSQNTGEFSLYIQRTERPGSQIEIDGYDQTISGTIGTTSLGQSYQIIAKQGDRVTAQATRTSGDFRPRVRIYDVSGRLLCSATNGDPSATIAGCDLANAGRYSIMVDDSSGQLFGDYQLYLDCLNDGCKELPVYYIFLPFITANP